MSDDHDGDTGHVAVRDRTPLITLDPVKVRQARLRQGWAEHPFAGALSVAPAVIRRLEHGRDQAAMTLAFVRDLTSLLGVTLADLLPDRADPEPYVSDVIEPGDPAAVGAVLASFQMPMGIDRLAVALCWTLERTLVALDALDGLLEPTGQRLAWHSDYRVQLAAHQMPEATARAAVSTLAEDGIDLTQARLLAKVADAGRPGALGPVSRFAVLSLEKAGLIDCSVLPASSANTSHAEDHRLTVLARCPPRI